MVFKCAGKIGERILEYTRFAYPGTKDWLQLRAKKKDPKKQSVVDNTVVNNDPVDCADTDVLERQATAEELTPGTETMVNSEYSPYGVQVHG